jgi:hypothetical protein
MNKWESLVIIAIIAFFAVIILLTVIDGNNERKIELEKFRIEAQYNASGTEPAVKAHE